MIARTVQGHARGEEGFSLIEMLVTLTILVAFMAVFTPFVGRLMSTWARNADGAQRADMVATAIDRIAADAAAAVPATEFHDGSDPRVRFTGTPTGYTLLLAGPETEAVSVSGAEAGRGTHSLVRVAQPAARATATPRPASRIALLDYPVTAQFAYRSAKGEESSDWRDAPALPAAIVVTFRRGKNLIFGGPVVVPVRATLPMDCVVAEQPLESLCGKPTAAPAEPAGEDQAPTDGEAAATAPKASSAPDQTVAKP